MLPPDDPQVYEFFNDGMDIKTLDKVAKAIMPNEEGEVITACTSFINMLLNLNTKRLTEDEKSALKRTTVVLNSVISEGSV